MRLFTSKLVWTGINKNESTIFKGIAILLIVTHNFMHLIKKGVPGENEFDFDPERFKTFLNLIVQDYPDIIRIFLHYLGHYGVQVFIFLSAYGLTKKYLTSKINYKSYLFDRVNKIYPAFILSLLFFLIYGFVTRGPLGPLKLVLEHWEAILLKLTLISNFVPEMALKPVGPWWFLPFIFQFYIVFPAMLSMTKKYGSSVLLFSSGAGIILSYLCRHADVNVYFTIIGHMPELCLGIYLAGKEKLRVPNYMLIVIVLVFVLGNLYLPFWYLSHICVLILLLLIFNGLKNTIQKNALINNLFVFFGVLSMYLFFVNGFLRWPLIVWAREFDHWAYSLMLCITFLAISAISSYTLIILEKKLRGGMRNWKGRMVKY